uniref:VWFD domain-containing protein n=1 Tax=Mola mola TaxID=94237 RepID=A0A3Q3WXU3_MOLML
MDCNNVDPPRKNGESWNVDNCTTSTCINGNVTETSVACPTRQQSICANGRSPVKVYSENGCCFHNECKCVCSVWGKSHYKTFDGKSYEFNKNCTYYLMKEINTKYNLTVTLQRDTQALTVKYRSNKVVFHSTGTTMVYVNGKHVYPAYSNSFLNLRGPNTEMSLEIPEINTEVVVKADFFILIDLPNALFGGNTEGQCGTCDNSQNNDCRSPNGQVESCSDSAGHWVVPGTSCVIPTTPPTTVPPPTTPKGPICNHDICDILTSSVFAPCHAVVSPGPYVKTCQNDYCTDKKIACRDLEAYATECSKEGVCIDWRNTTNGLCEYKCQSNKVYKACGPSVERTCNNRYNTIYQNGSETSTKKSREGCVCPPGTTLFNTVSNKCVSSCGKRTSHRNGCNTCVCDNDSMSVECERRPCTPKPSPNCTEPGQQLVNGTVDCCLNQTCAPTAKTTIKQEPFTPGPCQECYCGPKMDPITKLNTITCKPIVCYTNCSKGYEYQTVPNKCCGSCVQKSCIFTLDNMTHTIEVNETYVPPGDKCVHYTCENIKGQFFTKKTKISCPPFNSLDCEPVSMSCTYN